MRRDAQALLRALWLNTCVSDPKRKDRLLAVYSVSYCRTHEESITWPIHERLQLARASPFWTGHIIWYGSVLNSVSLTCKSVFNSLVIVLQNQLRDERGMYSWDLYRSCMPVWKTALFDILFNINVFVVRFVAPTITSGSCESQRNEDKKQQNKIYWKNILYNVQTLI